MPPIRISIVPTVSYEPLIGAIAKFILAVSIFGILFAGLFPFDFQFPKSGLAYHVRTWFDHSPEPAILADKVQNILFFVPFGFGVAAVIRRGRIVARNVTRVIVALVLGFALSITVELLQVFLGFRDPTWVDVLMNTTGAGAGALLLVSTRDQSLRAIAKPLMRLSPYVTFRNVAAVLVVYVIVQLLLPLATMNRGRLANWDHAFPLLVGNETNGERGWGGNVWRVNLWSRAANGDQVKRLLDDPSAAEILKPFACGSYELLGPGPYPDRSDTLPPLEWVGEAAGEPPATNPATTSHPASITPQRWLRTSGGAARAVHRIRSSSEFTLSTMIAPAVEDQRGPARIVSISGDGHVRNFSLMHDYHQLSLRLRTPLIGPDGSAPEAIVDDVFDSTQPKHIVITYADAVMIAYVDGVERGRMEITPEAALIWRLYPRSGWKVKLGQYGFRSYAAIYRVLVLVPFAALLAAMVSLGRFDRRQQLLAIAGAVILFSLALELILGSLTASGFQLQNLFISVAICAMALLGLRGMRARSALR
jgi:glycopeptide antibiotics resistance protein